MTIGSLYIVATPIGNLQDISQRAIATLTNVNSIAAEDTRHSRKLLQHLGINTPMIAYHEHNEKNKATQLIERLTHGESIALISDAGTPLISDPGFQLVKLARENNIPVIPIPGPSALITALSAAGLPCDRFTFEGFLAAKKNKRREQLVELLFEKRTLIFYESPHRILDFLKDMQACFGPDRQVVIARELTKTFESIHTATLSELPNWLQADENRLRGEFVVLVEGAKHSSEECQLYEEERVLKLLLNELPHKQAVALAAKITGAHKNKLYDMALLLK